MKDFFINNKNKISKVLGFVLFFVILAVFYTKVTYLFRNSSSDRIHVVGLKSEDPKPDVVYIGGSAAYVYWEPLQIFNDYGFTSYNLATNTFQAESILGYIKYAEKYADPDLYVVGVRSLQYYTDDQEEAGFRGASDGFNLSFLPRYEMIKNYFTNRNMDDNTDIPSYVFDIAKYHTNYENLSSEDAWELTDNSTDSRYKGYEIKKDWVYFEEPSDFKTDERAELLPGSKKSLEEVLDYCDKKKLNVLFVACPYVITKEQYAMYNTMSDMVTERGYTFLNVNDHYDDMGIDYATDFYDINHINIGGSRKYCDYLGKYIKDNYSLADHREDPAYDSWKAVYPEFREATDNSAEAVDKTIADAKAAAGLGGEIRGTTDLTKWSSLVSDYHYSLLVVGEGTSLGNAAYDDKQSLERLGIDPDTIGYKEKYINVLADPMHQINVPEATDDEMSLSVGQYRFKSDAVISGKDNINSIKIEDTEYSVKSPEGLNIVVFDNYYRTVIDSVALVSDNGHIQIKR